MTKYDELRQKMENNRKQFDNYEEECRQFIADFRSAIVDYIGCLDNRVQWKHFSPDEPEEKEKAKGVIEVTPDRRLALYANAFYGFVFQIQFFDPNIVIAGGNYLNLPMFVKKDGPKFTVKLGEVLKQVDHADLISLINYLVSEIEEYLDTEFLNFLKGKEPPKIGFLTSKE